MSLKGTTDMDKITIERETLKWAIRWHESRIWPGPDEVSVFDALRAALAQKAEPPSMPQGKSLALLDLDSVEHMQGGANGPTIRLRGFINAQTGPTAPQPPIDNAFVADGCEQFSPPAEPAPVPCCGKYETCSHACTPRGKWLGRREAERAALAVQPDDNEWRTAIEDELICAHIGTADSFSDAQSALKSLIDWHVSVSLDPAVSSDAQALIDRGRAAQPAGAQQEPNMRHPKIQALIGKNARQHIWMMLVEQLVEDPHFETTAMDMEYWDTLHDKLKEKLTAAQPAPAAVPPGMALVPIEPTPGIITTGTVALMKASDSDLDATREEIAATYRAMIAAAGDKP